jgi:hypothetical protein
MLVSIPSEGRHYLIDVVAGAVVALVVIVAIRGAQLDRVSMMRPARA